MVQKPIGTGEVGRKGRGWGRKALDFRKEVNGNMWAEHQKNFRKHIGIFL